MHASINVFNSGDFNLIPNGNVYLKYKINKVVFATKTDFKKC
jgi:hypothetical protein